MRPLLRFELENPLAVIFAVVIVALAGIYASLRMPVDLFPNLDVPLVNIITHDPAAAPEDLELLVTRPIEDEMRALPGVHRVASVSSQGISQVSVQFEWGTTVNEARQAVQTGLSHLSGRLPSGVNPTLENIGTTLQQVIGYVVFGGTDLVTLRNTVRYELSSRMMSVPGVAGVDVLGGDRRAFNIRLRPDALAALHLSVKDFVDRLAADNVTTVAGYVDRGGREYLVHGDARFLTLDDLRAVPVGRQNGVPVLLGDVAEVKEGHAPRHYVVHGNGVPGVAFFVRKQPGANTLQVVRGVKAAMGNLEQLFPAGTHVKLFYDQSEIIEEASSQVRRNLLLGMVLAVLVLYVFLGSWRPTLIVAVTIPATLFATLAAMGALGLDFNVITMTALTLAIGMVVDDAIVVSENIQRHRLRTDDRRTAILDGVGEIASADASGTFTTVAAFLPLLLTTGLASLFIRPFGLTISVALVLSLLLSLSLVPVLFSRGQGAIHEQDFFGARALHAVRNQLDSLLKLAFRHRVRTLLLAVAFLGFAGLTVLIGRVGLLPAIDEGAILIEYVLPPGTSLAESNRVGDRLDRIALADEDVTCVYRRTGSPETGFQVEGVNRGELKIKLRPKATRHRSLTAIMNSLRDSYSRIPGVVFLYHQPTQEKMDESFSGLPALFGVTIYGDNADSLVALAGRVEDVLKRDPGVSNIVNNTKVRATQLVVRLDRKRLAGYGVREQDVLTTLTAAQFGVEATDILRQQESVAVMVHVTGGNASGIDRIRTLPVIAQDGSSVPLERLADIRVEHTPAQVTRLNGQREVTLLADVGTAVTAAVHRLRGKLSKLHLPPGYSIDFTGQYKVMKQTVGELAFVILLAIVLIYMVMTVQFRSALQPLIILSTVPLSLVGALIALAVTRQGIDVSVGMGVVTLVGISVNNAIVLMDYANRNSRKGEGVNVALREAAAVRLRPILLTALTTIAALLPSAIGPTLGSKIFQPFAITVIGGLITGSIATLVIVPTLASHSE